MTTHFAPLTPLGKPLTQNPVVSADVPFDNPREPISAFDWFSVMRVTWKFLIRPMWHLCVKLPWQLVQAGSYVSPEEQKRRDDDWHDSRRNEEIYERCRQEHEARYGW